MVHRRKDSTFSHYAVSFANKGKGYEIIDRAMALDAAKALAEAHYKAHMKEAA